MNIFIDTNIYLSFYHFSSDDLEELKKLVLLLSQGKLKLFLPFQVIQEFQRNRENKIEDAMKKFNDQRLDFQFPQFCKDYLEHETLRELQKNYSQCHAALKEKLYSDIQTKKLRADTLFEELITNSKVIKISQKIYLRAQKRTEIGNPPGKSGSIGDAINWEALLQEIPDREDICFISDDKDYESPIDKYSFNAFLLDEWSITKTSQIKYYRSLSSFFRAYFPDISLELEPEKNAWIQSLSDSRSFANTHTIIEELDKYSDFTAEQANAIIAAAITNNQVSWIISDPDVQNFLEKLYENKKDKIHPVYKELLETRLDKVKLPPSPDNPPEDREDIPF